MGTIYNSPQTMVLHDAVLMSPDIERLNRITMHEQGVLKKSRKCFHDYCYVGTTFAVVLKDRCQEHLRGV